MAIISQVIEVVIAIIIFVFLVAVFHNVFGSPVCDRFANTTAEQLRIAINKVALEDGIAPYEGEGVPPDTATNQFITVPIRLCEKDPGSGLAWAFSHTPTYMLMYETWPEEGFAWSESQPFSGGAVAALQTYFIVKYAVKAPFYIGKIIQGIKKLGRFIMKLPIKIPILVKKFINWLKGLKDNRIIRAILGRSEASSNVMPVEPTTVERLMEDLYPSDSRSTLNLIKSIESVKGYLDYQDWADIGIVEAKFDEVADRWVPVLDGKGRLIVKPEYSKLVKTYIELTEDIEEKEFLENMFYVPSKFEEFKVNYYYPFKYSVKNWLKSTRFWKYVVQKPKDIYNKLKDGFNKIFRRKGIDPFDSPQKAGAYKKWAFYNIDKFTESIKENFDEFKDVLEEATGKVLKSADDVSTADVYKLIVKYDNWFNAVPYAEFAVRGEAIVTQSFETMGYKIAKEAEDVIDPSTYYAWQSKWKDWDFMTIQQQYDLRDALMEGQPNVDSLTLAETRIIYEDAKAQLAKEGLLDANNVIKDGEFRASYFYNKIKKVKGQMFSGIVRRVEFNTYDEFKDAIPNFYLRPVIAPTSSNFEKIKNFLNRIKNIPGAQKLWSKGKEFVLLDLTRTGQGPIAPFTLFGNAYTEKEGLKRATTIQEGGCARNSICMLARGSVTGPEQGVSAYLLDEDVPEKLKGEIGVRLWRPKPSLTDRMPIWLSTGMFYFSVQEHPRFYVVSPCFALAKIWKNDETVYVKIEKEKKCDVSGCDMDTPNYCYADEEYIWGENLGFMGDVPSLWWYLAELGVCTGICTAAGSGSSWYACLKSCAYLGIGTLYIDTTQATFWYEGPSWKRQDTGWGYWNYQKANDICDILDLVVANFAGWRADKLARQTQTQTVKLGEGVTFSYGWGGTKKVSTLQKIKQWSGLDVGDLCYGLLIIGDSSLSWPIKTPIGQIWRKSVKLDEKCMGNSASNCAWINKCFRDEDCPQIPQPQRCNPETNMCERI